MATIINASNSTGLTLTSDLSGALSLQTVGVTAVTVSTGQAVNIPNQISFTANTNNTGTYATGAANVITFTNVATNIGNCYNSANGRFTVTVAGRYLLTASLMANTGTGRYYFILRKNGSTTIAQSGGDSTNYGNFSISYIATLAVDDYIEVYLTSGTLYNQSVPENYFTGHLLS